MSNSTRPGETDRLTMEEYQFTCPECAQYIDVNDEMRRAILSNGCPVCTAVVDAEDFGDDE